MIFGVKHKRLRTKENMISPTIERRFERDIIKTIFPLTQYCILVVHLIYVSLPSPPSPSKQRRPSTWWIYRSSICISLFHVQLHSLKMFYSPQFVINNTQEILQYHI